MPNPLSLTWTLHIDTGKVHQDVYGAAFRGVIDGIGDEVAENTFQGQRIGR